MTENINTTRRGFLSYFSKTVQSVKETPEQTHREAPRPPQAVDEALFVRLCNGCANCQTACPNGIITIDNQMAQVNLDYNECSLCGDCTRACPSGALHPTVTMNIHLRPHFSHVCNNYLNIDCLQCQLSCPKSAIVVKEDELPYVGVLCDGCGQCQKSCFVGAISMTFVANTTNLK